MRTVLTTNRKPGTPTSKLAMLSTPHSNSTHPPSHNSAPTPSNPNNPNNRSRATRATMQTVCLWARIHRVGDDLGKFLGFIYEMCLWEWHLWFGSAGWVHKIYIPCGKWTGSCYCFMILSPLYTLCSTAPARSQLPACDSVGTMHAHTCADFCTSRDLTRPHNNPIVSPDGYWRKLVSQAQDSGRLTVLDL
jgi:hypothetical protein